MFKNLSGQKLLVFAFDRDTAEPVLSDAAQITCKVAIDNGTATALTDVNPVETEDGRYLFDLTTAETNGDTLDFYPESSTSGVQVIALNHDRQTVVSGTVSPAPAGVRGGWFGAGWFGGGVGATTSVSASTLANGTIEARVGELKRVLIPCNQDISSSTLSFIVETKQKVDVGIVDDGSITKDGTTAELTLTAPMTSAERTLVWSLVIVGTNESVASGLLFCTYDAQGD